MSSPLQTRDSQHFSVNFYSSEKKVVGVYSPETKRVITIASKTLQNPLIWKVREFFNWDGGYCKLEVNNANPVLVKITELSEVLELSKKEVKEYSKSGLLSEQLKTRNLQIETSSTVESVSLKEHKVRELIRNGELRKGLSLCEKYYREGENRSAYESILAEFHFKPGEWSAISSEKPTVKFSEIETRGGFNWKVKFTKFEAQALEIWIKLEEEGGDFSPEKLSEADQIILRKFLLLIYQNADFNKRASEVLKGKGEDFLDDVQIKSGIRRLRTYSHKTQMITRFNTISKKIDKALQSMNKENSSESIAENAKLTLSDLRLVSSMTNRDMSGLRNDMSFLFEDIAKCGFNNSFLTSITRKINTASLFVTQVQQKWEEAEPTQTGDLYFLRFDRERQVTSSTGVSEIRYKVLHHQYQHIGFGIKKYSFRHNITGETMQVPPRMIHLLGGVGFSPNPIDIFDRLLNDQFRLSFDKMITGFGWTVLRSIYFDKIKNLPEKEAKEYIIKLITKEFHQITKNVLLNDRTHLSNAEPSYPNARFSRIRAIKSVFKRKKTKERSKVDPEEQAKIQEIQDTFCSEFAARLLGVSINILESKLRSFSKLKEWPEGASIFRNPLNDQNFASIHPDRLQELFSGISSPVKLPDFIEKIFKL